MEKYWIPEKVDLVKINRQLYRDERSCSKSVTFTLHVLGSERIVSIRFPSCLPFLCLSRKKALRAFCSVQFLLENITA